jgi:transposase
VEYVPRYAPEFNPDEQMWDHAKARLGRLFVATRDQLVREMRGIMGEIQRFHDLVSSFFQLRAKKYAADAC